MTEFSDKILAVKDGHVGRFTINNPDKRNCVSLAMWEQIGDIFEEWSSDPDVRVIVVTGAGDKCFCAGADIKEFDTVRKTPAQIAHYEAVFDRAIHNVGQVPKPTIARIDGACIGGGFELAMLCDLRIAADRATFGVTPARIGLGYSMNGIRLLLDNMSPTVVRELLYTGVWILRLCGPSLPTITIKYRDMIRRKVSLSILPLLVLHIIALLVSYALRVCQIAITQQSQL